MPDVTEILYGSNHNDIIDMGDWDASTGTYPATPGNALGYRYRVSVGGNVTTGSPPITITYIENEFILNRNGVWVKELDRSINKAGRQVTPATALTDITDTVINDNNGVLLIENDGADRDIDVTGTQDFRIIHYDYSHTIRLHDPLASPTLIVTLNPGDGYDMLNPTGLVYNPVKYNRAELTVARSLSASFNNLTDYDIVVGNATTDRLAKVYFVITDGTIFKTGEIIVGTDGTNVAVDTVELNSTGDFTSFTTSGSINGNDIVLTLNANSGGSGFILKYRIEHSL